MVLKLYGSPVSTCTKRVAAVLHEKRVPFEFVPVDLTKGEHKITAFTAHQPFGQVPYVDDDGFVLFESRAIARYVARTYAGQGTPLVPDAADLRACARFEQAASIEASNFDVFASGIAKERVFNPCATVGRVWRVAETLTQFCSCCLQEARAGDEPEGPPVSRGDARRQAGRLRGDPVEAEVPCRRRMSCRFFLLLCPQKITLADLFHLPYGAVMETLGYNYLRDEKRPNVVRCVVLRLGCYARLLIACGAQVVEGHHLPPVVAGGQGQGRGDRLNGGAMCTCAVTPHYTKSIRRARCRQSVRDEFHLPSVAGPELRLSYPVEETCVASPSFMLNRLDRTLGPTTA
jgi:glutathione S-transferase